MNVSIHQLVNYFAEAPLYFVNAYEHSSVPALESGTTIHTSIDSCSLLLTLSGSAYVTIEGEDEQYKLESGIVLHQTLNKKLQLIRYGELPWCYVVLNYRGLPSNADSHPIGNDNFIVYTGKPSSDMLQQLHLLLDPYKHLTPISKLKTKTSFYLFVQYMLLAIQQHNKTKHSELMLKAVDYMHKRYNKPISVTQISTIIGIERRRFAYLFERYTGMTPNHYLTSFRMKRSRELLRTQHYTVAQIAELVGYHDSFYFSRVFKKYNGISPSEYRKKYMYTYG